MAGYSEINADELFPSDDSMAIIVAQSKELIVVPPKEVGPVRHHQCYYTQATPMLHLSPPPSRLSIEGPWHQQEMPKFHVSKELNLLPPKPNEVLTGLNTNKFRDVTCMKYRSTTRRTSFEGVQAMPEQIQVKPPRTRSPSSSSSPSSSGQKHKRTSNADLEKQIEALLRSSEMLTQTDVRNKQSLAAQAAMIGRLTKRVDMLEVKYSGLKAKHHIACRTIVNRIEEVEEKEKKKEKRCERESRVD
jgi:hypothetical protein